MDSELIKMCDCPEIQDRWKPKVGQLVKDKSGGEPFIIQSVHFKSAVLHRPMIIYIPRIEDVLEWIGEWLHCLVRQSDEEIGDDMMSDERWLVSVFDKDGCSYDGAYANTAIQSLIKAFMHLEHNKTWNGEVWA